MKAKNHISRLISAFAVSQCALMAATFDSGSNGSYGPLDVTANTTLNMPPDGIFHCTTIHISLGATLTFRRNALNTPVYLLATGDVSIDGGVFQRSGGLIDVSGANGTQALAGEGGPAGYDSGQPGASNNAGPGDGNGPGAGRVGPNGFSGSAAFGAQPQSTRDPNLDVYNGAKYGNSLLIPLIGGSGGAGSSGNPGTGGGGGGGAILIASNTRITIPYSGGIRAKGGTGERGVAGGGSGGAIRLVAPVVAGGGYMDVGGGDAGGAGRIRIDTLDRSNWQFSFQGPMTYGTKMFVFPPTVPSLDIVEAAGQAIPLGTSSAVRVDLPATTSPNQIVKIRAKDFSGQVPINVVVTPDSGPSTTFPATLDMSAGNPTVATVAVVIPAGTVSRINAWTR